MLIVQQMTPFPSARWLRISAPQSNHHPCEMRRFKRCATLIRYFLFDLKIDSPDGRDKKDTAMCKKHVAQFLLSVLMATLCACETAVWEMVLQDRKVRCVLHEFLLSSVI